MLKEVIILQQFENFKNEPVELSTYLFPQPNYNTTSHVGKMLC